MIGSIGVILGAALIWFTGWGWVDSAVAVLIGLWVVPRTLTLLKSSINILLEGVPEGVDLAQVEAALLAVPGVRSLHDLHVWSVTSGKTMLTVHLVTAPESSGSATLLVSARQRLATDFGIRHVTVQCEPTPCHLAGDAAHLRSRAHR